MPDPELTSPPSQGGPPDYDFFRQLDRRSAALLTSTFGKHLLLVAIMVVGTIWFADTNQNFACRKAERWLNLFNGSDPDNGVNFCDDGDDKKPQVPQPATSASPPANANSTGVGNAGNSNASNSNAGNADTSPESPLLLGAEGSTPATPAGGAGTQSSPTPTPTCTPPADEYQRRLDEQMRTIRARANHHGEVMAFFYRAYYMATAVVLLTGIIAAIALFTIAQKGWGPTNQYVKTVFVVMTASAAYYGLYPPVFEQQKNISDNKELFLEYKTLENEVRSFPKTCGNLKKEANTPEAFINYIDSELDRLGNIAIGFDYTKINYKGAFDLTDGDGDGNNAAPTNANTGGTPARTPARRPGGR
jgi:hypothetical protein